MNGTSRLIAGICAGLLLAGTVSLSGCRVRQKNQENENTTLAASAGQTQAEEPVSSAQAEQTETAQDQTEAASAAQSSQEGGSGAGQAAAVDTSAHQGNPIPTQRVGNGVHPLTGLPGYDSDYYAHKKVIGVVVENHPGARPQWGMSTPDVIFEYEVEGGISRMLWLYANMDEMPQKVGPVRSMRHDIVELARGYDLFFIHCGGSYIAQDKLNSYNGALSEIDAGSFGACFTRDTTRNTAIEHRLILLSDAFRSAVNNRTLNLTASYAQPGYFRFADANSSFRPGTAACGSVHFEYSGNYTYTFNYNSGNGTYEANINGSPRVDDLGIQCAYKNLILLYVDMEDMHTEKGHQDLLLENGGKGIYAANGSYAEITWKKGTDTDMLRLYDKDGKELTLNAGNSYIGLVRSTQNKKTVIS